MLRVALVIVAVVALSGCQMVLCESGADCSGVRMDRGGQQTSTLPVSVTDPNVQVNAAGDQSRD